MSNLTTSNAFFCHIKNTRNCVYLTAGLFLALILSACGGGEDTIIPFLDSEGEVLSIEAPENFDNRHPVSGVLTVNTTSDEDSMSDEDSTSEDGSASDSAEDPATETITFKFILVDGEYIADRPLNLAKKCESADCDLVVNWTTAKPGEFDPEKFDVTVEDGEVKYKRTEDLPPLESIQTLESMLTASFPPGITSGSVLCKQITLNQITPNGDILVKDLNRDAYEKAADPGVEKILNGFERETYPNRISFSVGEVGSSDLKELLALHVSINDENVYICDLLPQPKIEFFGINNPITPENRHYKVEDLHGSISYELEEIESEKISVTWEIETTTIDTAPTVDTENSRAVELDKADVLYKEPDNSDSAKEALGDGFFAEDTIVGNSTRKKYEFCANKPILITLSLSRDFAENEGVINSDTGEPLGLVSNETVNHKINWTGDPTKDDDSDNAPCIVE